MSILSFKIVLEWLDAQNLSNLNRTLILNEYDHWVVLDQG